MTKIKPLNANLSSNNLTKSFEISKNKCFLFNIQDSFFSSLQKDIFFVKVTMIYREFGPTGIKVSVIGYGNWTDSNPKIEQ